MVGCTNLNDSPSAGKLTAADLAPSPPPRIPRERHVSVYGLGGLLLCAVAAFATGAWIVRLVLQLMP